MPVSVSIALSGLDRKDFYTCPHLFQQGEQVVNRQLIYHPLPPPIGPSTSCLGVYKQRSSSVSSRSSSPDLTPIDGECFSPENYADYGTYSFPQLCLRDYCCLKIDMATVDYSEKLQMLQVYDKALSNPKPKDNKQPITTKSNEKPQLSRDQSMTINWQGRNLLELGLNMRSNSNMIQPAITATDTSNSSETSTPSRPDDPAEKCQFGDCCFEESHLPE